MRYVTCLTFGLVLFAAGFVALLGPVREGWLSIVAFPWASIGGLMLLEARRAGNLFR